MTPNAREAVLQLRNDAAVYFATAVHSRGRVSGLTHEFYKYPARFSPVFARAAIQAFTDEGDLVLDPFMGGATTVVEALVLGRTAIGLDINQLSCFVAEAKTTPLSRHDITAVKRWAAQTARGLNMRRPVARATDWLTYQRNISTRKTWAIRKSLELSLARVPLLKNRQQELFARALLLRTAQWALDCRSDVPSVGEFKERFLVFRDEMLAGLSEFAMATGKQKQIKSVILNRSAKGAELDPQVTALGAPRLVLTSPPYPGVHVNYHRWQVLGRRETPAPYWIANRLDGSGASYYTFGHRLHPGLKTYFENARQIFTSLAALGDKRTLFVQMLAFSEPEWQLPEYLHVMRLAGLEEIYVPDLANHNDGRLWRAVPNRKWYADQRGEAGAGKEVVLFHRKA